MPQAANHKAPDRMAPAKMPGGSPDPVICAPPQPGGLECTIRAVTFFFP